MSRATRSSVINLGLALIFAALLSSAWRLDGTMIEDHTGVAG